MILGTLYRPGQTTALREFDRADRSDIVGSRGSRLIDAYWGNYVALLGPTNTGTVGIVWSPLSTLPAFHSAVDGCVIVASDVDLLIRLGGYRPALSWQANARHLAGVDIGRPETCLEGVAEVPGGHRLNGPIRGRTRNGTFLPFFPHEQNSTVRRKPTQRL